MWYATLLSQKKGSFVSPSGSLSVHRRAAQTKLFPVQPRARQIACIDQTKLAILNSDASDIHHGTIARAWTQTRTITIHMFV